MTSEARDDLRVETDATIVPGEQGFQMEIKKRGSTKQPILCLDRTPTLVAQGIHIQSADTARVLLVGCDLCKADFTKADLSFAYLCWADLSDTKLNGAVLCEANLERANLEKGRGQDWFQGERGGRAQQRG
ncbi:hypothetical protein CYMTET_24207 [Cymbomonas tetramitiformis]|uniref:Pentapeptide repeat-containing protein n=1 Tax=Cymbomonas tetramitiformis TaxID=36881 RepID=A0AAE0L0G6_9CHLO|nr:hypothetical protein CYMTET_24207 [Cymbomonas tetramitiformis]